VPRYFFDVYDGFQERDDEGVVCANLQAAAYEANRLLPALALSKAPKDSDHQIITVLVTDEEGHPVYQAALSQIGTWLIR
jgi:hypothetical protein